MLLFCKQLSQDILKKEGIILPVNNILYVIKIMTEIINIIQEIREYINKARKQSILLKNKYTWNQLCSSMDIIEDTELAIHEYLKLNNVKEDGLKYLFVFGIMQILFVQQDAIIHMSEALGFNFQLDSDLKNIRNIRNDSVGHPTKRGNGINSKYNFIFRAYLSHKNLSLMTVSPKEKDYTKFYHYDIVKLIDSQRKSINSSLKELVRMLQNEEKEHIGQYNDKEIADLFPSTLNYHFQKLTESSLVSKERQFRKINFDIITSTLKKFKLELKKRDSLDAYIGVNIVLEDLIYPIEKLRKFFSNEVNLDEEEVKIYSFYVKKQFDELIEMAKEIDEYYKKNV